MASEDNIINENFIFDFLDELAEAAAQQAKNIQINQSKHPKGGLSEQWGFEREGLSIMITNEADYAEYWLYGRGPISMYGTDRWLHWVDPTSGSDIFSKYSGPVEANTAFEPTLDYWIHGNAEQILNEAIAAAGM